MITSDSKILIIAPHADDETLACGGSVAKHIETGACVHLIVCGTREHDDPMHLVEATSQYTSVDQYEYRDESYYSSFNALLTSVETSYSKIKPDVIYIPNKHDFNMDHKCVHEISEIVCRRFQTHAPSMVLMYEVPSSTTQSFNNNFRCNYYECLQESHMESKILSMSKYERELREYPNPRSEDGLWVYARFRGMECNESLAEGFNLIYHKT